MNKKFEYIVKNGDIINKWMVSDLVETPLNSERKPFDEVYRISQDWKEIIYPIRKDFLRKKKFELSEKYNLSCEKVYYPFENKKVEYSWFWHTPHELDFAAKNEFYFEKEAEAEFEITTCGGAKIYVNGEKVDEFYPYTRNIGTSKVVKLPFKKGMNIVEIEVNDIAERDAMMYFRMKSLYEGEFKVVLPVEVDEERIEEVRSILQNIYLDKFNYENNEINLYFSEDTDKDLEFQVQVVNGAHHNIHIPRKGTKVLSKGSKTIYIGDLNPGEIGMMRVSVSMDVGDIHLNRELDYEFYPEEFIPKKVEKIEDRKKVALNHLAKRGLSNLQRALALLETEPSSKEIGEILDIEMKRINERYDCSDFRMPALVWMYRKYKDTDLLSAEQKKEIKKAILNYRYWFDEPGNDVMWFFSENHALNFHAAEILAGETFKDEVFSNSGLKGWEHAEKAKGLIKDWMTNFFKIGYSEWNSSVYIPIDMIAYFALYENVEDTEIKEMSKRALDITFEIFAKNNYKGVLASSYGRIYDKNLLGRRTTESAMLNWIAFGEGFMPVHVFSSVLFALSGYEPSKELAEIANWDSSEKFEDESVQGIEDANLRMCKTKDYIMGSVFDFNSGEAGSQEHVLQIFLKDVDTQLWINHPGEAKLFGEGRPSYLSGNGTLPKVIQKGNTAGIFYRLIPTQEVKYTHIFCPIEKFDKTVKKDNWLFLEKENVFVGVYADNGYRIADEGPLKNSEIISEGLENFWLVKLSTKEEAGSFEEFIEKMYDSKLKVDGDKAEYKDYQYGDLKFEY